MRTRCAIAIPLLALLCVGATECSRSFPYRVTAIASDDAGPRFARLERDGRGFLVEGGAVLDDGYRVEAVVESGIRVTELADERHFLVALEEPETSPETEPRPELVVSWSGGPLPPEAVDPPPDTVVLLELASAGALGAAAPEGEGDPPDLVVGVDCPPGTLPPEVLDPPEGAVVGLVEPSDGGGGSGVCVPAASAPAQDEIVVPVEAGGSLPPEVLDPPPGTLVKLPAPAT
jgi:hypothetical protein